MRSSRKRRIVVGIVAALLSLGVGGPLLIWRSLTYEPAFYRRHAAVPASVRKAEADHFESQSLQLRNDIANEGRWEAVFTDEEVNAWLSEKLVRHFADYIPTGVRDPLVVFERDRVTFAFRVDQGPITSLVWVVTRARVADESTIALTLEKIRAGAMPVPTEELAPRLTANARSHGLDVRWAEEQGEPVAYIHYSPAPGRVDVVLESIRVLDGQLYISRPFRPQRRPPFPADPARPSRPSDDLPRQSEETQRQPFDLIVDRFS